MVYNVTVKFFLQNIRRDWHCLA